MKREVLKLNECLKNYTFDQDKAITPVETVKRFEARLKKVNLDILKEIRRIDTGRLDIPVYFSVCGKDAVDTIGTKKQMGKGSTPEQSRASACMELGERFSFFSFKKNEKNFVTATWEEMKKTGEPMLPPARLLQAVHDDNMAPATLERLLEGIPMQWTWATNLTTGRGVMVPFSWFYAINEFNGPSAGNTYEEAVSQGVCEIVERHVCSVISREKRPVPLIDPDSITDPVAKELLDKFTRNGIKVFLSDFSLDTGIPTVGALAWDPSTFPETSEIVYTAGTTPDPTKAVIRALTEVAQLAGDFHSNANYVASGLPKPLSLDEVKYITDPGKTVKLSDLPDLGHDNMRVEDERMMESLARLDLEVLVVNTRHELLDIPTMYTIVPGAHFRERSMAGDAGLFVAKLAMERIDNPAGRRQAILNLKRHLPEAYYLEFYLGRNLAENGDPEEGLAHLERAMTLAPDPEDVPYILSYAGMCLKDMERYDEAIEVLKKGCGADDERPDLHNMLGFCYFRKKDHEAAIRHFTRAVELAPTSAIDYANLGVNYREIGKNDEAVKSFALALSMDPGIDFARRHMEEMTIEGKS